MNLRRRKPHDSLYMLLDTMCNAFGGIILLAVLVVLLTSKEKTQSAAATDSTELQRRIALAETNLQQSLQLSATLHAQANDDRWKNQVSLLTTRQQLENELNQLRTLAAENAQQIDATAEVDPAERMKQLATTTAEQRTKKLETQNKLTAAEEEKKRDAAHLAALEKQMSDLAKLSQRDLRLPREHNTDRYVFYVIVIYNRIYPCFNADLTRNESDIKWTTSETDAASTAEPKKGKGLDAVADAAQLRTYFATMWRRVRSTWFLSRCRTHSPPSSKPNN